MDYHISTALASQRLIGIDIPLPPNPEPTVLALPKWRPGRYEIGPYVENICDVSAVDAAGNALKVRKNGTHEWAIDPSNEAFTFRYHYYAVATDAGGSSLKEDLLYINGVNLFMYEPGHLNDPCQLHLDLSDDFQVACGLPHVDGTLQAKDFHQLVDAPILASPNLTHHSFPVAGTTHHLWFYGDVRLNLDVVEEHFKAYGEAQVELFGGIPVDDYHYLFLIHDFTAYHGVEHFNSTVITLGPSYRLALPDLYHELLGVSSHELFHTWNVKAIRPADMRPYDYSGPNYSQLHYVTEGVTTYYGDLMLLKSGVWDLNRYLTNFNNAVMKRHYANHGRNHISLEQASFDSWINGYKPGIPNRKISFYTKGCLAAFILDYLIRSTTGNARSLDTVMREMYDRFGKTEIGYRRQDYREIAEKHAGTSLGRYFKQVIASTAPLEPYLIDAADYFGLGLFPRQIQNSFVRDLGILTDGAEPMVKIKHIYENSPASQAGLKVDDELVAVGGLKAQTKDLSPLFDHFRGQSKMELAVFRQGRLLQLEVNLRSGYQTDIYMLSPLDGPTPDQLENRRSWMTVS